MLNTCSDCLFYAIQLFGRVTKRMLARSLFMDQAFETTGSTDSRSIRLNMQNLPRRSYVHFLDRIMLKHLSVVNISWDHGITADKTMVNFDAGAGRIAVVVDAILFDPAYVQVYLLQSI